MKKSLLALILVMVLILPSILQYNNIMDEGNSIVTSMESNSGSVSMLKRASEVTSGSEIVQMESGRKVSEIIPSSALWEYRTAGEILYPPLVADVDNDVDNEVILTDSKGYFYILSHKGFLLTNKKYGDLIVAPPIPANLDYDDKLELVVPYNDSLRALNDDGSLLWMIEASVTGVAIADLDGDGDTEVILVSKDSISILHSDGTELASLPTDSEAKSIAIGNIVSDGSYEIVINTGEKILILDDELNKLQEVEVGSGVINLFLVDLDGDSLEELLVLKEDSLSVFKGSENIWSYTSNSELLPVSISDLDGDGALDIIIPNGDKIVALKGNGEELWTFNLQSKAKTPATIADLDNDRKPEILISTEDASLYGIDSDGILLFEDKLDAVLSVPPAVGDVDADGKLEMLLALSGGTVRIEELSNPGFLVFWRAGYGSAEYSNTFSISTFDKDYDNLPDIYEGMFGTDVNNKDSDGDSYSDGMEIYHSTNPLDEFSYPILGFEVKSHSVTWDGSTVTASIVLSSDSLRTLKVEFSLVDGEGSIVHQDEKTSNIQGEEEIAFTWDASSLIGDYYYSFTVKEGQITVFDSGQLFAFTASESTFSSDLGTLSASSYVETSTQFSLTPHQSAVLTVQVLEPLKNVTIDVFLASSADLRIDFGNETLSASRRIYSTNGKASITVYNVPMGSYHIQITAYSSAQVSKVKITSDEALSEGIQWVALSDKYRIVDKIEGTVGEQKTYSVKVRYFTSTFDTLTFVAIKGVQKLVYKSVDIQPLTLDPTVVFDFELQFPNQEELSTVSLKFNLSDGNELVKVVPYKVKKPSAKLNLEYKVVKYYQIPGSLNIFEQQEMREVAEEELKALKVEDISIVDVGVEGGVIKNATVKFSVRNVYSFEWLWMSAHAYYDLYFYPTLSANGSWVEKYFSIVVFDELETVTVPGVPVKYVNGQPVVELYIKFVKSWWANLLEFALKTIFSFVPVPGADFIPSIIMWAVNLIADWWYIGFSIDDLKLALKMILGIDADAILNNLFGSSNPDTVAKTSSPIQILLTIASKVNEYKWSIFAFLLKWTLNKMKDNPQIFSSILSEAIKRVTGKSVTIAASTIKSAAKAALTAIAVIELIFDAIGKLLAPNMEKKEVSTRYSQVDGEFSKVSLGDPLLILEFSGDLNSTNLNSTRTFYIQSLHLSVNATEDEAKFMMEVTPRADAKVTLESLLADKSSRDSLLGFFGIIPVSTRMYYQGESMVIDGGGYFTYSFNSLNLVIEDGKVRGIAKQPILVSVSDGVWSVDIPVVYAFGKGIDYNVTLVLPPRRANVNIETPGYVLNGDSVIWTNEPDRIKLTFEADSDAPLIVANVEDESFFGDKVELNLSISDEALYSVKLYIDGKPYETWYKKTQISTEIDTSILGNGAHELLIIAIDENGNIATKRIRIYVDNSPPFVGELPSKLYASNELNFQITAFDETLSKISVIVDDNELVSWNYGMKANVVLDVSSISEGNHNITIKAVDKAGNTFERSSSLIVDRTSPELRAFIYKRDGSRLTFSVIVEDNLSGVKHVVLVYKADNSEWKTIDMTYNSGLTWVAEVDASNAAVVEAYVIAYDNAGNEGETETIVINMQSNILPIVLLVTIPIVAGVTLFILARKKGIKFRFPIRK